jgi:ABC-type nitrate/sulfonate/bicarbonate transport system substrate-binding protein
MRKIVLIVSMLFFITLLLMGSIYINRQTYDGPIEKIIVGNIGEFSIFDIVAKQKGYFQKNNLDVQIVHFESGPSAITDLLAGKVDIAVAADFVGVRNIFAHPELRILTQASIHKVFYLIGRPDKGIRDIQDLKHKKIGVTRKGAGEFYLGQFLNFNHLSFEDITVVDLSPAEMITMLETGEIDAAVIFDPHAYKLKKKLGHNAVSWSVQGDRETFALVYTTESFIKEHPETVAKYLRSLLQAEKFFTDNPTSAQDFMIESLQYDREYILHMWPNFTFSHRLDQELLLTMEDQARFVMSNNLTTKTTFPNYLHFIYFTGLENIDPERITIIH